MVTAVVGTDEVSDRWQVGVEVVVQLPELDVEFQQDDHLLLDVLNGHLQPTHVTSQL
jgi:hypothetical protein